MTDLQPQHIIEGTFDPVDAIRTLAKVLAMSTSRIADLQHRVKDLEDRLEALQDSKIMLPGDKPAGPAKKPKP